MNLEYTLCYFIEINEFSAFLDLLMTHRKCGEEKCLCSLPVSEKAHPRSIATMISAGSAFEEKYLLTALILAPNAVLLFNNFPPSTTFE